MSKGVFETIGDFASSLFSSGTNTNIYNTQSSNYEGVDYKSQLAQNNKFYGIAIMSFIIATIGIVLIIFKKNN